MLRNLTVAFICAVTTGLLGAPVLAADPLMILGHGSGLEGQRIVALKGDGARGCFAATQSGGLFRVDANTATAKMVVAPREVDTIHGMADDGHALWLATSRGLARWAEGEGLEFVTRQSVAQVASGYDHLAWLTGRVATIRSRKGDVEQNPFVVPPEPPFVMAVDGQDLAVGSEDGLVVGKAPTWFHYGQQMRSKRVLALAWYARNFALAGTEDGLLLLSTRRDGFGRRLPELLFLGPGGWTSGPSKEPTVVSAVATIDRGQFLVGVSGAAPRVFVGEAHGLVEVPLGRLREITRSPSGESRITGLAMSYSVLWVAGPTGLAAYGRPDMAAVATVPKSDEGPTIAGGNEPVAGAKAGGGAAIHFINVRELVEKPLNPKINGKAVPEVPLIWDEGNSLPTPRTPSGDLSLTEKPRPSTAPRKVPAQEVLKTVEAPIAPRGASDDLSGRHQLVIVACMVLLALAILKTRP